MYYLVDTENVPIGTWLAHADGFTSNDTIILFVNCTHGGSVPIAELAKITSGQAKTRILIEKCSPGKNSMDLSIAAKSGELFSKERQKARSYTIVSNDCGYDGFIDTCRKAGHDIVRTPVVMTSTVESIIHVTNKPAKKNQKDLTKEQKKKINAFCAQYGLNASKVREISKHALNNDTPNTFVGTLRNFCSGQYKKKKKVNAVMEHASELVGIVYQAA